MVVNSSLPYRIHFDWLYSCSLTYVLLVLRIFFSNSCLNSGGGSKRNLKQSAPDCKLNICHKFIVIWWWRWRGTMFQFNGLLRLRLHFSNDVFFLYLYTEGALSKCSSMLYFLKTFLFSRRDYACFFFKPASTSFSSVHLLVSSLNSSNGIRFTYQMRSQFVSMYNCTS